MAKDKAITTQPTGTTALAERSPYARDFAVPEGLENILRIPTVHIFQGTNQEKAEFGKLDDGVLLNKVTKEKLPSTKFMLLSSGWVEYERFDRMGEGQPSRFVYRYKDIKKVPPGDLEWGGDSEARIPPACAKIWMCPALFEGMETPIALAIKLTHGKNNKAAGFVMQVEQERAKMGRCPLLWDFQTETDHRKSDPNKTWLAPKFVSAGEPPESMLKTAQALVEAVKTAVVDTGEVPQSESFDPDAM